MALSRRRQLLAAVGGTAVLAVLLTGCDLPIPPFDDGIPNCTVETVPTPFGPSHERFVDELGYRYSTMFGCQTGWNPLFRGEPIY